MRAHLGDVAAASPVAAHNEALLPDRHRSGDVETSWPGFTSCDRRSASTMTAAKPCPVASADMRCKRREGLPHHRGCRTTRISSSRQYQAGGAGAPATRPSRRGRPTRGRGARFTQETHLGCGKNRPLHTPRHIRAMMFPRMYQCTRHLPPRCEHMFVCMCNLRSEASAQVAFRRPQ